MNITTITDAIVEAEDRLSRIWEDLHEAVALGDEYGLRDDLQGALERLRDAVDEAQAQAASIDPGDIQDALHDAQRERQARRDLTELELEEQMEALARPYSTRSDASLDTPGAWQDEELADRLARTILRTIREGLAR